MSQVNNRTDPRSSHLNNNNNAASISTRFIAKIIDGIVSQIFVGIIFGNHQHVALLSFIASFLYDYFFYMYIKKDTLGKQAMGIKLITENGAAFTAYDIFIRQLTVALNVFFFVDFAWCLFERRSRCLHDLTVGTVVVYDQTNNNL